MSAQSRRTPRADSPVRSTAGGEQSPPAFFSAYLPEGRTPDILWAMVDEPYNAMIDEAERAGFDMSLIEESLRCSYEQRAIEHQRALDLALEMERVGQRLRERSQSTSTPSLRR